MDLNPCRCGELEFEPRHWLEQHGEHLVTTYEGECPGCGATRRFEFQLASDMPPAPPTFGGEQASQLIDPGQFLWVAEQFASSVPADPAELTPSESREEAQEALETAVAAVEEVLKFIPDGADSVPEETFTAPEGWMLYHQEPGRFQRYRLEAILEAYREGLAAYSG